MHHNRRYAIAFTVVLAAAPADAALGPVTASVEPSRIARGQTVTVTIEGDEPAGCSPEFHQLNRSIANDFPPADQPHQTWQVVFKDCPGGPAVVTPFRESFTFEPTPGGFSSLPEERNRVEVVLLDPAGENPEQVGVLSFVVVRPEDLPPVDVLHLRDGRFEVTATWRDFAGRSGSAHAIPGASGVSGQLWFFSPDNPELTVKVLDGCAFNDRYWVLSAGATNVEYHLRVVDTQTGKTWTSDNALGYFSQAAADTSAFVCR